MVVICRKNLIPCPYAVRDKDENIHCRISEGICKNQVEEYQKDFPNNFKKLQRLKSSLGEEVLYIEENELIRKVIIELEK